MKIGPHMRVKSTWHRYDDDKGPHLTSCNVLLVTGGKPFLLMGTWTARPHGVDVERDDFDWALAEGGAIAKELKIPIVVESPMGRREVAFSDPRQALEVEVEDKPEDSGGEEDALDS